MKENQKRTKRKKQEIYQKGLVKIVKLVEYFSWHMSPLIVINDNIPKPSHNVNGLFFLFNSRLFL